MTLRNHENLIQKIDDLAMAAYMAALAITDNLQRPAMRAVLSELTDATSVLIDELERPDIAADTPTP